MQKFEKGFFVGAATAAHQVEGNNIHSDYWAQEQLPHTSFAEPSGIACDHYNRYEEDIRLLADAGLNAYRFSIEWARIEPEEGKFDPAEIEHYRKLFDDSEAAHPITEEEFIKVENICGKLFLVGAEDDALWDTAKYIRRMEKRLAEKPHSCEVEAVVYEHGTHFVFPDGMLKTMLPVGSALFVKLAFSAAKKYPRECKTARIDIDRRMTRVICDWRDKK